MTIPKVSPYPMSERNFGMRGSGRRKDERGRTRNAAGSPKNDYKPNPDCLYLAFFKPFGVVTQFSEAEGENETLADFGFPPDVYPVGRLDSDSEGLLILTDDTRLNGKLLDPVNAHEREYWAQVENVPDQAALSKLRNGVLVQGRRTQPCRAELVAGEPSLPPRTVPIRFRKNIPTAWLKLRLTEGKNRQVRRMTAAVGFPTLRLVRYAIGSFTLDDLNLEPGYWRELEHSEVKALFRTRK